MTDSKRSRTSSPTSSQPSPLTRWASSLLLASALFLMATIVTWGVQGERGAAGWSFAGCGLLCLLGWFIGRRGAQRGGALSADNFARQRTMLGANAVLSVGLLWLILGGVNWLAMRHHRTFDLSANAINSLSEQTRNILNRLPGPVRLTYIWNGSGARPADAAGANAQLQLQAYADASSQIKVDFLNAAADPLRAGSIAPTFTGQQPLLVLQREDVAAGNAKAAKAARQQAAVVDESNISAALLRLIDPTPRVLYFLSSHGEWTPFNTRGPAGLGALALALDGQNYGFKTLPPLGARSEIPAEASAVLVIAPRTDLSPEELQVLQRYLSARGRLVLMMQPFLGPTPPRWSALLRRLGYEILSGVVIDSEQATPQIPRGVWGAAAGHPIGRGINGDVEFPGATPLRLLGLRAPSVWRPTALFETSPRATAQVPNNTSRPVSGSFVLAAAGERSATQGKARVVVTSNARFATDAWAGRFGNLSFALSAINWAAGQDELVSIAPKTPVNNTLSMPESTRRLSILMSLFVLPVLLLLLGGGVWWKRR